MGLDLELDNLTGRYWLKGPHRVLPGRLSVARTFGDIEAKLPECNGNPRTIISEPEISIFKITHDLDFMLIGSDGIFDRLGNKELVQGIWSLTDSLKTTNIHEHCARTVEYVIGEATLAKKSSDNVTAVFIAF
jgi:protein phosphatase 2C family protein 2/3